MGHQVTVLTAFPHHPTGVKSPRDSWVLTRRDKVDEIDVLRTYVYATRNKGIRRRMLSYGSFMLSAIGIGALRSGPADVVVATSPQLLSAVAGYVLSVAKSVPFVFEVRDLWPESILAVEAMKNNLVVRALMRLARYLYHRSDRIVTVGEGYKRQIQERYGVCAEKMDVIPNGIHPEVFVPGERANGIRSEYGWNDRFVALYVGTHGMAHGLSTVLKAAHELRHEPDILFAFVGEGAEKDNLQKQAAELRLPNVQFIGQQSKSRVLDFYSACDLGLVTLRNTPLFQAVLPSKIFEYLGMERPVLISVDGEARELVERAGAGTYVPPEDTGAMVSEIRRLHGLRDDLEAMGRSGRRFVTAHFDRRVLAAKYLQILSHVVQAPAVHRA